MGALMWINFNGQSRPVARPVVATVAMETRLVGPIDHRGLIVGGAVLDPLTIDVEVHQPVGSIELLDPASPVPGGTDRIVVSTATTINLWVFDARRVRFGNYLVH